MSDNFGFSEKYMTSDGKEWIDASCVREALGIGEDYNADILGEIKKLKEERERYKSNCDYFAGIAEDKMCDRNKLELELREALGIVDEYADIPGLVRKLKKERDELKDRCGKLEDRVRTYRIIANGTYGVSCGYSEYSGDKAPAFLCNVISYSWEFSPIVAQSLMDEPSYRLNNDYIRVELNLTPTANYKGTFDMEDLKKYIQEYGREKKLGSIKSVDYQNAKEARVELAYLYKTVLGKEKLDRDLSPHEVMNAILDAVKKLRDAQFASDQCLRSVYMHIYEGTGYNVSDIYAAPDKIADWIITRYDSTKTLGHMETICDINDCIDELCNKYTVVQPDRKSTTKERLDYIFAVLAEHKDLANSNFNKAEGFRKEKRAVENSLYELRAKVREIYRSVVDDEWDEYRGYTSALNDINEEYKRVVHNFEEDTFRHAICNALNIPTTVIDGNIIGRIHLIQDCHDTLCKDYTEFRKAIWEAMDRKPETLPEETARLVGEVTELARGEKLLIEFRDAVAKAIGMDYPTTNNFILKRVSDIYKERGESHDLAMELDRKCIDLTAKNSDLKQKFDFQSGLRRTWHARYESEHERANGVQKALDREREKCRVKDISLETAKKQYEKVRNNLETAECALNGMRNKVRELREEKTKVISAIGQDIWDDAVK